MMSLPKKGVGVHEPATLKEKQRGGVVCVGVVWSLWKMREGKLPEQPHGEGKAHVDVHRKKKYLKQGRFA